MPAIATYGLRKFYFSLKIAGQNGSLTKVTFRKLKCIGKVATMIYKEGDYARRIN